MSVRQVAARLLVQFHQPWFIGWEDAVRRNANLGFRSTIIVVFLSYTEVTFAATVAPWQVGSAGAREAIPPKFLPGGNFLYTIRGWKSPFLRKFKGEIKILSTYDLLCRKFAAACLKTASSSDSSLIPKLFLTYDAVVQVGLRLRHWHAKRCGQCSSASFGFMDLQTEYFQKKHRFYTRTNKYYSRSCYTCKSYDEHPQQHSRNS